MERTMKSFAGCYLTQGLATYQGLVIRYGYERQKRTLGSVLGQRLLAGTTSHHDLPT